MTFLSICATFFGTLSALANIPQAIKIFHRKSAGDISITTYILVLLGVIFWIFYGIELKNYPIVFANAVGFISISLVIIGWFIYGRKKHNKK